MHPSVALHNVSVSTGTFAAQLRGSSTAGARGLRVNALTTYNRRGSRTAMCAILATHRAAAPQQASAITRASLARLSHVARPRFNALQRLASHALSTNTRGRDSSFVVNAAAAVSNHDAVTAQPSRQQVNVNGLESAFAASSSTALPPLPRFGGLSELGCLDGFDRDYELGEEIGSGSFGTVFVASSLHDGEEVAVKVLPKQPAVSGRHRRGSGRAGREIHMAKIHKELDVLRQLQQHGNAVGLKGVYEDAHNVYIVMEECRGGDLEQLMEDYGALTERQTALIMYEALQTVAACHQARIYHGDIKPANFMLANALPERSISGELEKLQPGTWLRAIDFGCAQPVQEGVSLTRKTGTPMFMAPEVFIGDYGLEADVWAAGMMMYQLLSNRFPWWSTMEELHTTTLEEVMQAVIQRDIPLDYGIWKAVSPECRDLIQAMLTRDPAQRISAADAMRHPWFRHFGIGAQRPDMDRQVSGNVVPMSRSMSDRLRLKLCGAEISRAATRQPAELSGLLDAMLEPTNEEDEPRDLCSTFG